MKTRLRFTAFTVALFSALLLFGSVILSGCADNALTEQDAEALAQTPRSSKMRHAHLFGQSDGAGKLVARFEDLVTHTEFIVAADDIVLDMDRLVQRYQDETGVTIKRIYRRAFKGLAMHVDDDEVERLLNLLDGDDEVAWVEPDPKFSKGRSGKVRNMSAGQRPVSSMGHIHAANSSAASGDGQGSVDLDLYVLDTGVEHADLNIVERIDFSAAGQDIDMTKLVERFEETMDPASDGIGHGTHVAGIAADIDVPVMSTTLV